MNGGPGIVGEPRADHLDDPPADDVGRQRSAVKKDRVGPRGPVRRLVAFGHDRLGPVPAQEKAQVLGYGRIGDERQAKFLQATLGRPAGSSARSTRAKKPSSAIASTSARVQFRLDTAADQFRPAPGDRDWPAINGRLLLA